MKKMVNNNGMDPQAKKIIGSVITGFIVLIALGIFFGSLYSIPEGNSGVIYKSAMGTKGFNYVEKGPGIHMKVPFFHTVHKLSFMTRTLYMGEGVAEKRTAQNFPTLTPKDKNGINFNQDLAVRFRMNPEQMAEFMELKGKSPEELVVTAIRGVARNVIGQFAQEDIPENRAEVATEIRIQLQARLDEEATGRLQPGYLVIEAVDVRNTQFNGKIEEAINSKMVQKQEAERKQYELQSAEKEIEIRMAEAEANKQSAILVAEGEAQAVLVVAEAKAKGIKLVNSAYQDMPEEYVAVKYAEALQANAANGNLMILDPDVIGLGVMNMNQLMGAGVLG